MSQANVMVLGGPSTGKTHYAGQLLGRLRHDRSGSLKLKPGGSDDFGKFEEVLSCLEEGRSAGHTPAKTWTGMTWELESQSGKEIVIEWPEYAGEQLNNIFDSRSFSPQWRTSILNATGWMLFVRPAALQIYDDMVSRPAANQAKAKESESATTDVGWDDRARLVELLQMLLFVAKQSTESRVASPKLAIVLSCWDEVGQAGSPSSYFENSLAILNSFVRQNWTEDSWSVWGISSLGQSLSPTKKDEEFSLQGPENFGYVIEQGDSEANSDLTKPLAWLLGV